MEAQRHHLRRTHPSDIITEVLDAGLLLLALPPSTTRCSPPWGVFDLPEGLGAQKQGRRRLRFLGWSGQAVGLITKELEAMKLKVVHEGFRVKYIPEAEELAAARTLGEKLAREHLPGKV